MTAKDEDLGFVTMEINGITIRAPRFRASEHKAQRIHSRAPELLAGLRAGVGQAQPGQIAKRFAVKFRNPFCLIVRVLRSRRTEFRD